MVWIYTLISVIIVSLLSLAGVFTLAINRARLYQVLIYFVSLSAGTLMGDAFIHLIPEAYKGSDQTVVSLYILSGIFLFFILEKVLHWRHCHEEPCEDHPHPFSYVILVGDTFHNFIDGMVIAASYIVSVPVGFATTVAVILHEIPHEIGDFASLLYGGFAVRKAVLYNFLSALAAVAGALVVLIINIETNLTNFLVPFAAGGFIYVAGTDLIPELHKHTEIKKGFWQVVMFLLGVGMMAALLVLE